ncbi:hypothetical protein BT69DRAFT_1012509 [Atractiella rhizophila]|nr:hypothetical protein BT69DRAFT_1012509 [Atractiella rhizophila]
MACWTGLKVARYLEWVQFESGQDLVTKRRSQISSSYCQRREGLLQIDRWYQPTSAWYRIFLRLFVSACGANDNLNVRVNPTQATTKSTTSVVMATIRLYLPNCCCRSSKSSRHTRRPKRDECRIRQFRGVQFDSIDVPVPSTSQQDTVLPSSTLT